MTTIIFGSIRRDMTLEELERPKAKERQGTRTDLQPSVRPNEKLDATKTTCDLAPERFDVREVVAPAVENVREVEEIGR